MSKIGNKPVEVPDNVSINIGKTSSGQKEVKIKGGDSEFIFQIPEHLDIVFEDKKLSVKRANENKKTKSLHGLYRNLMFNAVTGIVTPWTKKLEVVGTGYNVKMQGEDMVFKVGYSHPVVFKKQPGIKYTVEGNNKITVTGADKQLVGQVAYQIKLIKKPDPYKGKGLRYQGEQLKLKPGKKAKTEAS